MSTQLSIHTGASLVTLEDVRNAPTPPPTATWHPIPHEHLINEVWDNLSQFGMTITNERHALYHGDSGSDRYFGVFDLVRNGGSEHDDYSIAVGLRNSHDQTFPAAMVLGSHVFVCDNLAFSGEVKIARKHTRWIERDLPRLVYQASAKIVDAMGLQTKRIQSYKDAALSTLDAHHILVLSVQKQILPGRFLDDVANEWDAPRHEEFAPRTAWSLFNAYTEILKESSHVELPKRTQALHGLFDQSVGLLTGPSSLDDN